MPAIRVLLEGSIDYAGLFPPAGLDMAAAVRNYGVYRGDEAAWALGRFVLPVSRLSEFELAAAGLLPRAPAPDGWRLAVLAGPDPAGELPAVGEFNCRHAAEGAAAVAADVVELKCDSVEGIGRIADALPSYLQAYVEIPLGDHLDVLVAAIARRGMRAKVRTGGVTSEAFPTTPQLLRFLRVCIEAGVGFKATAGLHHPLRAEYRLTYASDAPRGTMYGFLNLFLAAAFLWQGMDDREAAELLEERSPAAFDVGPDEIGWRRHRLGREELELARREAIVSFGSCSFTEPIDDLQFLGLLQPAEPPRGRDART